MQRVITAIRCGLKWNVKRSTVFRMVRRYMKLDTREKNLGLNDAIKERENKVYIRGELKCLEKDEQECSHDLDAQFLANRWHKKYTCFETVQFSADFLLNKG